VRKKQSIENRIAFTLIGYTVFIVLLLWAFQILFLNSYYNTMRRNGVVEAGTEIAAAANGENFESSIESICYQNRISCIVFDDRGEIVYSVDMLGRSSFIHNQGKNAMSRIAAPIIKGEKTEDTFMFRDERFKNDSIIYIKAVTNSQGKRATIMLNAPLSPVEATKDILISQLKIIAVMLIAIALLLSKFAARKLSDPIRNITHKAKRLANGDYLADYDGGGIYEIDELAETLNFSAEGLSKVEELRRELVANVSHDLKTPLTMIKAYAEMIKDITGDNKQARDDQLDTIINESDRLTELVNDLIKISREETDAANIVKADFDIKAKIEDIIARFAAVHEDYDIIFEADCDKWAHADGDKIGQVLYNFISNAVNYTGEDKKVRIKLYQSGDKMLHVDIIDSGRGIAPEELPLIWERYYRSKNTHQRPIVGTGLGLSIVKSILTNQNLPFGVKSELGKGSCFWFELPEQKHPHKYLN